MIGREDALSSAIAVVSAGASVDVVGGRGSGRSSFLAELRHRLERLDWTVLTAAGIASLRSHPLVAMQLAGIDDSQDRRVPLTISRVVDALTRMARPKRTVLLLDDWDDLDEASWGVAEAVRRHEGLPIVVSRLQGLRARHTPTGLAASSTQPSYVVDMHPLRFEDLEQVLVERLGNPIDAGAISRVYSKSGGVVGLAVSLVDAAVRDGRMRLEHGIWTAARDLWSPALRGIVEAHLEALDRQARDALETIALIGVADVDTVRLLVDWDVLERLEELSMIMLFPSGTRQLVSVVPPLLVEFFRHEPLAARRIRLTEHVLSVLGSSDSADAIIGTPVSEAESMADGDALFVRLVHEHARTRRLVAHAEWERSPSPTTAVPYLRALMEVNPSRPHIEQVLEKTPASLIDDHARAEFAVIRAQWAAYVGDDLGAALDGLRSVPRESPFGRLADAAAIGLEADFRAVPADVAERLEVTDELPEAVKVTLRQAHMGVLIVQGRFADARRVFGEIDSSEPTPAGYPPNVLFGLVLLGEGRYDAALAWAQRGFDEAHGHLDVEGIRAHGYVTCVCLIMQGDYAKAEAILATVLGMGDPPPFHRSRQLGLLSIASVIAFRRGRSSLGNRYATEIDAITTPDGPLPGQSRIWASAQQAVVNGQGTTAADIVWKGSLKLWERGAVFVGAMGLLASLEIARTPERTAIAVERATMIGGELLLAEAAYARALQDEDAEALLKAAPRLHATGRTGHAMSAYITAAELFTAGGKMLEAQQATAERHALAATLGPYDVARFSTRAVILSEREREIVHLVADGLTNQQIADRLVLSVRTIESHLHRMSQKTGAKNRRELKEMVDSGLFER